MRQPPPDQVGGHLHSLAFFALAFIAAAYAGPVAAAAGAAPTPLFRYADRAIPESSGMAVSSYDDRVVYTHNDSGGAARFFAVDAATGATLAAYRVPGATNVDWEDMAAAPEATGRRSLWFADIGDNRGLRPDIAIYLVPEPRVDRRRRGVSATTSPPATTRLRYPDGPHDAEALLVDARRATVYVATKSLSGQTSVYATQLRLQPTSTLRLVATVELGVGAAVTGGAVSRAGDRLVLRTYAGAYLWPLGPGGVPAALRQPPVRVPLPTMPQGESVAFRSDGTLLVGSEGLHSAVYAVRLAGPVATPAPTPTPDPTPAPSATPAARRDAPGLRPVGRVLLVAALVAAGGWVMRRRRTRRRTSRPHGVGAGRS